jgi:hypothetical protein
MKIKSLYSKPYLTSYSIVALIFLLVLVSLAQSVQAKKDGRGLTINQSDSVKELPAASKRFALIIGVDRYADTQLTTLGGSSNDVRILKDALISNAGFPEDQVVVLASDQPAERQPTRGNILRRLSNLATLVPKDGLLLFSFAGHGIERGDQAFLLPADAQVSNDVNLLEQTAVNVLSIKEWIRRIGVGQVIMILDACRNDPSGRADADNRLTKAYTKGFDFEVRNRDVQAFVTLYATEVGHRAYEYKEKGNGYFTWALVEGLKGGAANERGEVTLSRLITYLQERVPKQVLLDLGSGKKQVPWAAVEGYRANELVISNAKSSRIAKDTKTPPKQSADTPTNKTPKPPVEDKSRDAGINLLEGTTWAGSTMYGEFEIEFLAGGKLRYTLLSNKRPVGGTWRVVGNQIFMNVGFTMWEGTIEHNLMKGDAASQDGEKYRWNMSPKAR